MSIIFCFSAFALPNPSPGLFVPSAVPVEAGQVEVSTGAMSGLSLIGTAVGGDVRLGVAPADGVWVSASASLFQTETVGLFGMGGSTTVTPTVSLSSGWALARGPHHWTGPVVAVVTPAFTSSALAGWSVGAVLGPKGQTVFDAAVMVGPSRSGDGSFVGEDGDESVLGALETGVRFGADRPDQLRLALVGVGSVPLDGSPSDALGWPMLDVTYRRQFDRWYLELGTTGVLLVQTGRVEVGFSF